MSILSSAAAKRVAWIFVVVMRLPAAAMLVAGCLMIKLAWALTGHGWPGVWIHEEGYARERLL